MLDKVAKKLLSADALLLLVSLLFYFFYFAPILFNLNSVLSGVTLDTLKNYYTYLYHTTDNGDWMNFRGMNYPFGEHLVYTDCQPLLCWVFRPLDFCHPYLIGILHFLMFFSHIITPNILLQIFRKAGMAQWPAAACALGIGLLSPQFLKIQAGHHSLSYACVIPVAILLIQKLIMNGRRSDMLQLFLFNSLLYLIHPYFGFSVSVFVFFALSFDGVFTLRMKDIIRRTLQALVLAILPLILFKLFMLITDHKTDRPEEPIGVNFMIENLHSLLSPDFGPMQHLTENWLSNKPGHFEGHTYLGLAVILSTILFVITLVFRRRLVWIERTTGAILLSSFVLLMLAFGYHFDLLQALNIRSSAFNQFRATCRFAWFFYYALPVFVLPAIARSLDAQRKLQLAGACLFALISAVEAHYLFKYNEAAYWHFPNFFRERFLTAEQKQIVSEINAAQPQAIIPLPLFHGGSELYDRLGSNNSMTPSMLYSFHCRLPIMSVSLSRTSAGETEDLIQSINAYRRKHVTDSLFSQQKDFLLLRTRDSLLPDEQRLLMKADFRKQFDSLAIWTISPQDFRRPYYDSSMSVLEGRQVDTSAKIIYVHYEARKPFLPASYMDTEVITEIRSTQFKPGPKIVSLHLHYGSKHYKALAGDLIVEKLSEKNSEWVQNIPLRILSGFYPGYGVFEYNIFLEQGTTYRFLIRGWQQNQYRISDFMLRDRNRTVIVKKGRDTVSINNFPLF